MVELVGRSDSDRAGDSSMRQSATGYHCNAQGVTVCNSCLKQTAISLRSCEAEFYAASFCAGQLLGLAELFTEPHYKVSVLPEMDSDSVRQALQEKRNERTEAHKHSLLIHVQQWIREDYW